MVDTLHDYKIGQQVDGNAKKISLCPSLGFILLRLFLAFNLAFYATELSSVTSAFTARIIHSLEPGVVKY